MARSNENGPNRSNLRRTLEVALANRKLSDELIDELVEMQTAFNALLAKMDADAGITDVDYESTLAVTPVE